MNEPIKVLLADDHPMFLEGVTHALEKYSHIQVVSVCNDGNEVENFIHRFPVDVAVLDVNMPEKNGVELCRHIRKQYHHIKVVFLTMYHPGALDAGNNPLPLAEGYVLKNSGSSILVDAIVKVHGGEKFIDPRLSGILQFPPIDILPAKIKLSSREKEIIKLAIQGKSNREIAQQLFISELTVKTHRKNIHEKLGIKNLAEMVQTVQRLGIDLNT